LAAEEPERLDVRGLDEGQEDFAGDGHAVLVVDPGPMGQPEDAGELGPAVLPED